MAPLSTVAALWSGGLGVVAVWAGLRTRTSAQSSSRETTPRSVLLLRPCAGHEAGLDEALRSSACAPRTAPVRFLIAQETNPAASAAGRASTLLAGQGRVARVVVTHARAPNMKAAQLARALELETERADVIVVADSDVALSSEVLSALLEPIASGKAHATWAPPVETRPSTRADRASASILDASLHSFPLLAGLDPRGMVGKLCAVRRDALEAVGGFEALLEHLGEDVELSRRLRRHGMRVASCAAVATSLASGRSWSDVVHRYARWIAVVRAQRTPLLVTYPLLLAATPLIVVLGCVALSSEGASAVLALALAMAVRFGVAVLARRRAGVPVRPLRALFDGLGADLLLLAAFGLALVRRRVVWRGVHLELAPRGVLERGR